MNVHKNARQTPRGRVLMIKRIERGVAVRQAAADAGVSERTAHRWLERWLGGPGAGRPQFGPAALPAPAGDGADRADRPASPATARPTAPGSLPRPCSRPGSATSAPGPTRRAPMARQNASSRPRSGNGPMPGHTRRPRPVTWPSAHGPMPTTSPGPMPASQVHHPSSN